MRGWLARARPDIVAGLVSAAIAIPLVINLAREVSSRLRRANRTIHHLVS